MVDGNRAHFRIVVSEMHDDFGYAWLHVARGEVSVNGEALAAGDALKTDAATIEIAKGSGAELLVFDLPA